MSNIQESRHPAKYNKTHRYPSVGQSGGYNEDAKFVKGYLLAHNLPQNVTKPLNDGNGLRYASVYA